MNILQEEKENSKNARISDFFNFEPNRLDNFSFELENLYFDFSHTILSQNGLDELLKNYANKIEDARKKMFSGEAINFTENRSVLHFALRDKKREWFSKGKPLGSLLENEYDKASDFANKIYNGEILAKNGKKFETILHIGIGGSDLGPRFVYDALKPFVHKGPKIRFCSNIEPTDFMNAICDIDPQTTLVVCVSKTFSTIETLTNFKMAREWLQNSIGEDDIDHLVAISSAKDKAIKYGINSERIFGFEEWVGGRFSMWSNVGLSLEMAFGKSVINEFFEGAKMMDIHFENAPAKNNIPLIAGLIAYWNTKYMGFESRATIPYSTRLILLPKFLQQLEMESNGKNIDNNGNKISVSCPIIWGAEGSNAQHAFFQHLHQSPIITPVEFLIFGDDGTNYKNSTRLTLASALAQSESLMLGKSLEKVEEEMKQAGFSDLEIAKIAPHRVFEGNRPSNLIYMPNLSPYILGALLAFYEHRCFVEGILYNINSFDQWGVELGKTIALEIENDLINGASEKRAPSIAKIIEIIKKQNN